MGPIIYPCLKYPIIMTYAYSCPDRICSIFMASRRSTSQFWLISPGGYSVQVSSELPESPVPESPLPVSPSSEVPDDTSPGGSPLSHTSGLSVVLVSRESYQFLYVSESTSCRQRTFPMRFFSPNTFIYSQPPSLRGEKLPSTKIAVIPSQFRKK